jgi:hypothetical protein
MELQTENWSCGVHRQLAAGESIGDGCPERFAVADLRVRPASGSVSYCRER